LIKIETESGFSCEIREDLGGDYELLELLIRLDQGDQTALPAALNLVLGEKQKAALLEHLRGEDGRVRTLEVHKALLEIFRARNSLKN